MRVNFRVGLRYAAVITGRNLRESLIQSILGASAQFFPYSSSHSLAPQSQSRSDADFSWMFLVFARLSIFKAASLISGAGFPHTGVPHET